jgi:hypothetical protein
VESSRDEVYSRRVRAGKRTYYIDVRSTRSGNDFYLTITESKRGGEEEREKFKIFLYKEDFEKFREAFNQALDFVYGELGKINALPRSHARDDYHRDDYQRDEYQRNDAPRGADAGRNDVNRSDAPSREETGRGDDLSRGFGSSDYQTSDD